MLIEGLFVPLTTPLDRDGKVYVAKLQSNVRRYSLAPVAGLVALTDPGEGEAFSEQEVAEVLRAVAAAASAEKVLVAAVLCGSVQSAVERIAVAAACGFDVALVGVPAGAGWREDEVRVFFHAVAEASALPVLLWSRAGAALSVEAVRDAARHAKVRGVVDAELTPERMQALREATREVQRSATVTTVFAPVTRRMLALDAAAPLLSAESLLGGAGKANSGATPLKTRVKTTGFAVMSGAASDMLPMLEAGAAGTMAALAACAPQACFEVYAAFKDGDPALAAVKQQRIVEADVVLGKLGVAGVKYGCDRNAYFGGAPRSPRLALLAAERAEMDAMFAGIPS